MKIYKVGGAVRDSLLKVMHQITIGLLLDPLKVEMIQWAINK